MWRFRQWKPKHIQVLKCKFLNRFPTATLSEDICTPTSGGMYIYASERLGVFTMPSLAFSRADLRTTNQRSLMSGKGRMSGWWHIATVSFLGSTSMESALLYSSSACRHANCADVPPLNKSFAIKSSQAEGSPLG